MDFISFSLIIFVIAFIIFICGVVDLNKNYNTKNDDILKKNLELVQKDEIYDKLKYIQPQQIFLSGIIDIDKLSKDVNNLKNEYKSLIDKNENINLTESIKKLENENDNLSTDVTNLNKILIDKNKELDDLLKAHDTKREEFESILFIYTLKNIL